MSTLLSPRDWGREIAEALGGSDPARHGVFDDVLRPDALRRLQDELLSSCEWHYRAQPGYVLCQRLDGTGVAGALADEARERASVLDPDLEVCERWAFLHQRPLEEFVHTDVGSYVFTLWLTPERWDRSPESSGLTLYALSRPDGMENAREYTTAYFEAQRPRAAAYVAYRENRAVLFPASTFHAIGPCDFDASTSAKMRCSMTVILDTPEHWRQQHEGYE